MKHENPERYHPLLPASHFPTILKSINLHPQSTPRTILLLIHIQQWTRRPITPQQITITNIVIPPSNLIPCIPENPIDPPTLLPKPIDIIHKLPHRRPIQTTSRRRIPRRDFRDPKRLVAELGMEGIQVPDRRSGRRQVHVDIIGREERLAAARRVEGGQPVAAGIRRHRRHELRALAPQRQERLDRISGLLRAHRGCRAHVAVIRLVESEQPLWRIRALHHADCGSDVGGESHHGDLCGGGFGAAAARWRQPEGDPAGGGANGVEHAGVIATVEGDGFEVRRAACCTRGASCGVAVSCGGGGGRAYAG